MPDYRNTDIHLYEPKTPGNTPRDTSQDGTHRHSIDINEGGEHSHNLNNFYHFGGNGAGETVAHNNLPKY